MRREDTFLLSHKQFAVKPTSLRVRSRDTTVDMAVDAVWFKTKNGLLTAHAGSLWDIFRADSVPSDAGIDWFLDNVNTQRYGGNFRARYDGTNYRGTENVADMMVDIEFLGSVLDRWPLVPEGYTGWWVF